MIELEIGKGEWERGEEGERISSKAKARTEPRHKAGAVNSDKS